MSTSIASIVNLPLLYFSIVLQVRKHSMPWEGLLPVGFEPSIVLLNSNAFAATAIRVPYNKNTSNSLWAAPPTYRIFLDQLSFNHFRLVT